MDGSTSPLQLYSHNHEADSKTPSTKLRRAKVGLGAEVTTTSPPRSIHHRHLPTCEPFTSPVPSKNILNPHWMKVPTSGRAKVVLVILQCLLLLTVEGGACP